MCYNVTMSIIKGKKPSLKPTPPPDDVLLALDIGTEFVKAVIARQKKDDTLEIIGVGRAHQDPSNMHAGAIADIGAVVATCEKALSDAEKQAVLLANSSKEILLPCIISAKMAIAHFPSKKCRSLLNAFRTEPGN